MRRLHPHRHRVGLRAVADLVPVVTVSDVQFDMGPVVVLLDTDDDGPTWYRWEGEDGIPITPLGPPLQPGDWVAVLRTGKELATWA